MARKGGADQGRVVVAFRPAAADGRMRTVGRDGERGTILLFTGVRYERFPDDETFLAALAPRLSPVGDRPGP